MSQDGVHEFLKPLSWLFGKWTSSSHGKGQYPTINDFEYMEEAEFTPLGAKPMIQYSMYSRHPTNGNGMHREVGFIRVKPQSNQIAFVVAHNVGVVEIQEGEVNGQSLTVETTDVGRASFNKSPAVKKLRRTLTFAEDKLEQVIAMETENTEMTEHLRITFSKNSES